VTGTVAGLPLGYQPLWAFHDIMCDAASAAATVWPGLSRMALVNLGDLRFYLFKSELRLI